MPGTVLLHLYRSAQYDSDYADEHAAQDTPDRRKPADVDAGGATHSCAL